MICVSLFLSLNVSAEELIKFDIDKQRADKAIIAFAQQTNQTIIFSYDLAKKYQTNRLKGYYSIRSGLKKLLYDIDLDALVDDSGQLSITYQQKSERKIIDKELSIQTSLVSDSSSKVPQKYLDQAPSIEKITIIGSRVSGRLADELPVPVDIFSADLLANTGQTEVGQMLKSLAPSFNFSSSAISDGTDALRPATLRGLGPDQTLVLINGKRRHQASLIHINTTVGRGTAGT
ncbi:MAG: TonB-dependent receptor plug domain-containing protein, partial [Alteromonadaceae bacterium]